MSGHDQFVEQAREFKTALTEADAFTPGEIAAMLGSFVRAFYITTIQSMPSPEQSEMATKNGILADRMLAMLADDDFNLE